MYASRALVAIVLVFAVVVQGQYRFANCPSASQKITLTSLLIEPHPIKIPGPVKFTLGVKVDEDIADPIAAAFLLKATAFGFTTTIKCENGVGSCNYTDWKAVCPTCPSPILGGDQVFTIPMNMTATIPIGNSAKAQAKINFRSATGQTGCVDMTNIDVRK